MVQIQVYRHGELSNIGPEEGDAELPVSLSLPSRKRVPYVAPYEALLAGFDFEALSVGTTATQFTRATYRPTAGEAADLAVFRVEVAPVRYRLDMTAPTASVGSLLQVGDEVAIWGLADLDSFRVISANGVSATLSTHYYRRG